MRGVICVFLFLGATGGACGQAYAQALYSSIAGVVSDREGGALPGANVIATERVSGISHRAVASADGKYSLGAIPAGDYRVEIYSPGFRRYSAEEVHVTEKQQTELNALLEPGSILEIGRLSTSINVSGESLLLPDSPSVLQVFGSRTIEQLPLNAQSPSVLAELAPGFVVTEEVEAHTDDNPPETSSFNIAASLANRNTYLIDGSDNTRVTHGQLSYAPPQDSVREVVVQVFSVDPAIGHSAPGVIEVVSRGGTNVPHGSLYEFNQVSALAANTWLNDSNAKPKPVTRQNRFGATAGGPVVIPKVRIGVNRLFWFAAYEGLRNNAPQSSSLTVPTAAERNGDFSALLALGTQYQIYNPFAGVLSGSTVTRQPFAGNIIPATLISPVAKNLLKYFPLPNETGLPNGQRNFTAGEQNNSTDNENGRLDYSLTARNRLSWNVRHESRALVDSNWFSNAATGRFDDREAWGTSLSDIFTATPNTIIDTRVNLSRLVARLYSGGGTPFNFAQLGLPSSLAAASAQLAFPSINAVGYTPLGSSNNGAGSTTPEDSIQITSGLTRIYTHHNLRAGLDLRHYVQGSQNYGYSSGLYTFNSSWTNGPTSTSAAAPLGQSLASLLLGLPTGGEFDHNASGVYRQNYGAAYFAEEWRALPNLTLTLGLRFDKDFPTTERSNRNVNGFHLSAANPIQPFAQAAYAKSPVSQLPVAAFATPGVLTFASPDARAIYHERSHVFSPRIGFAWTPWRSHPNTVLRGGFGIFTNPVSITGINQAGLSAVTPVTPTLNSFVTPYATLTNPFPAGLQQPVAFNSATALGTRVVFTNPNLQNPYTVVWNLDAVRQITTNLVLEVGYQGNHTVHLLENKPLDSIPVNFLSTAATRDAAAINLLSTPVANPFKGLFPNSTASLNSASSIALQQLLLPYPEYSSVTEMGANDASSYLEMGFVRLEKRFSTGLQLIGTYTHSRLMSRTSRLNPETPLVNMVSPQDYPNRIAFAGSYQLPFGRGSGRLAKTLAAGWFISTIFTYQTGAPLNWGNVISYGLPLHLDPHNPNHTFNTGAFDTISADQLFDNLRTFPQYFNNLRADSLLNDDLAVAKSFYFKEQAFLQLRFDFYNLFNHPVFASPSLNPTSEAFGTISNGTTNRSRAIQVGARLVW